MGKIQLNSVPYYIWMSTIDLANANNIILGTDMDPQNNGVGHLLGNEKQWVVLPPQYDDAVRDNGELAGALRNSTLYLGPKIP